LAKGIIAADKNENKQVKGSKEPEHRSCRYSVNDFAIIVMIGNNIGQK